MLSFIERNAKFFELQKAFNIVKMGSANTRWNEIKYVMPVKKPQR